MYIPKRRSSLSQQINDSDLVFEDDDEHTFGPGPVGCFNCCRSMTKTRRRSSSSFKVGSIIDSLLVDRTSASKSKPIEFKFNLSITDFSYHIKKGGQPPTVPKRIQAPIDVQYVEWQDTIGFGTTKLATMSNSNFSPTSSPFSTPPLVGNLDLASLYKDKPNFPGFLIPYRSTLQLSIKNTEDTTIAVNLLAYDLSKLPINHKRIVRYKSNSIVLQIPFFNFNKKYYLGDTIRLIMLNKEEMVRTNWEVITLSENSFDENFYRLCGKCKSI